MRRTLASPVSSANILSCVFTNCHFQLLPDYDFLGISAPRLHVSTSDFRRSYLTFQFSPRRLVVYTGSSLFLSRCSNVGIGWSLNPWTQLLRQLCVSTVKLFALLWQSMVAAACCRERRCASAFVQSSKLRWPQSSYRLPQGRCWAKHARSSLGQVLQRHCSLCTTCNLPLRLAASRE